MIDLSLEIEEFDDFIVGDYVDSYKNLTLKTFSGYKYYHQYCGGAKATWQQQQASDKSQVIENNNGVQWVLMQDDDTVIDEHLFSYLLDAYQSQKTRHTDCLGDKWKNMLVLRPDPTLTADLQLIRQKYDVSEDEYSLDTYPTYCGGPCALLSGSTMEKSFQGNGSIACSVKKSDNRFQ